MDALKKFGLWIVLGVLMAGLLLAQWLFVGARRQKAAEEHLEVVSKIEKFLTRKKPKLMKGPTKGDVGGGDKRLVTIQKEGVQAAKLWKHYTRGLERNLGNSDGGVLDSKEKKSVDPILFGEFVVEKYKKLFTETESAISAVMTPKWEEMLTVLLYAKNSLYLKKDDEALLAEAKRDAKTYAKSFSQICNVDKLVPITVDKKFSRPGEMWQTWRAYLIAEDMFKRVISKLVVPLPQEVASYPDSMRMTAEQLAETAPEDMPVVVDMDTIKTTEYRHIEGIEVLEVTEPEIGNGELTVKDGKLEVKKPKKGKAQYYDLFKVQIKVKAHIKVIDAMMREMGKSDSIYYVLMHAECMPFTDKETMGDYNLIAPDDYGMPESGRPAAPVKTLAGFEHEPPVTARLVYYVYRFRFSDTDNQKPRK